MLHHKDPLYSELVINRDHKCYIPQAFWCFSVFSLSLSPLFWGFDWFFDLVPLRFLFPVLFDFFLFLFFIRL